MPKRKLEKAVTARLAAIGWALAAISVAMPQASAQTVGSLRGQVTDDVLRLGSPGGDRQRDQRETTDLMTEDGFVPAPRPDVRVDQADPLASPFDQPPVDTAADPAADPVADLITGSVGALEPGIAAAPTRAVAPIGPVGPVQGLGGQREDDPFAPTGLRLGTFDVNVTLDLGVTHLRTVDTISDNSTPPVFTESETTGFSGDAALSLAARSDWSRHALDVSLRGNVPVQLSGDEPAEPAFDSSAALRLDLAADTTLRLTGGYAFSRVDPDSAAVFAVLDPILLPDLAVDGQSDRHRLNGEAELSRSVGLIALSGALNTERRFNGDARLNDGTSISQSDLDFNRYGARLRAGYSVSGVLAPFVQAQISQRVMDERPDAAGLDRNALGYVLSAGLAFDRGDKLRGEIAVGYLAEDLADDSLQDISGLSLGGFVNWSPQRETDVALSLSTDTSLGSSADVSGAINYSGNLAITHRARANLELTGEIGGSYEAVTGAGADTLTAAGTIGATYWFNRFAGLTSRLGYERSFSSDEAERGNTTSAFVGVRLQR